MSDCQPGSITAEKNENVQCDGEEKSKLCSKSKSPRKLLTIVNNNSCNNNNIIKSEGVNVLVIPTPEKHGESPVVVVKDELLQHHHDLTSLCRDLEQHKLDMQRQHSQLTEALRNLAAVTATTNEPSSTSQCSFEAPEGNQVYRHCSHGSEGVERGDKLRVRKEGRDEHGMNGTSSISFGTSYNSSTGGSGNGVTVKRDIWNEVLAGEGLDEGNVTEIAELADKSYSSSGLPPRTIPFRSASFSQVDITSEGKYVRNPRSPITLKPTAFCLMNNSYASGSSTLPRTHAKQAHRRKLASNSLDEDNTSLPIDDEQMSTQNSMLPLNREDSTGTDCGIIFNPYGITTLFHQQQFHLPETISEQSLVESVNVDDNNDTNALTNGNLDSINMDNPENTEKALCSVSATQTVQIHCNDATGKNDPCEPSETPNMSPSEMSKPQVTFENSDPSKESRDSVDCHLATDTKSSEPPGLVVDDLANCVDSDVVHESSDTIENETSTNAPANESLVPCESSSISPLTVFEKSYSVESVHISPTGKSEVTFNDDKVPFVTVSNEQVKEFAIPQELNFVDKDGNENRNDKASTNQRDLSLQVARPSKPQLVRSPPLIREESLMTRSSSEEGAKSDQEDEHDIRSLPSERNVLVSNPSTESSSASFNEKSLPRPRKPGKKHVLLDLELCGGSSVSGSGGEDDQDKDKQEQGLYRQSSGQSDESVEGDRQTVACASLHKTSHPNTNITLHHRSHLSAGNSPLTDALALDSPVRRGSTSSPATAPTAAHSASNLHSTSLPQSSPVSGETYFKGPTHAETCHGASRETDRLNSHSSPNVNRQIRGWKPLRGPYGEMLEAEMKKLKSNRELEFDNSDFLRESKSSSPSRSTQMEGESTIACGGNSLITRNSQQQPKMTSSKHMSSMDDLNLTKQKHSSTRSRKISANLPVTHFHPKGDGTPVAFHQRTASSPSQLLYASSSSGHDALAERRQLDASPRGHVLAEIVETEKSYVDSLRIIVKKYMEPLKASDIIDTGLVDEIFFQIPSILRHHDQLLDDLQKKVTDDQQCVGNVFLDMFRKTTLLDCYSLFVNNWKNAKGSLKMAVASKPQLSRFLEAQARQHKGKLSVDSLLIMPIQRIPRYELLLKELLKHTEAIHEDHSMLILALDRIKKFAVHIDCASVDLNGTREIEIEGWAAGLGHLVRYDIVTLCSSSNVKKERALFLFADSLVVASVKRKTTMRKPPQGHSTANSLEGCKFKLLMKLQLTDIHLVGEEHDSYSSASACATGAAAMCGKSVQGPSSSATSSSHHSDELDDLKTIQKMMDLANLLKCPHVGLDEVLRELASGLKHHCDNNADILDIEIKAGENSDIPEAFRVYFGTPEKKNCWVDAFQDTLGKFIRYGFGKLPQVQFIQALPIRKTRAGLQLSCAAPVTLYNKASKTLEMTDLWVANSDGYVGQICILTLHPEPAITSCNGVCNSRITCIIAVPPPSYSHLGTSSYESFAGAHDASHHHPHHPIFHSLGYESEDDHHRSKQGQKGLSEHWSVWLGTEDGSLHVYDCSDSIRVKKNRHKVQHKSPTNCMVFFDRRVFVGLGNGDVAVYNRNPHGKGWLINDASWVTIGTAMNPVTKMICVKSFIWCACGSQIKIYSENGGMLELVQTIQIIVEGNQMPRGVSAMVGTDQQVWIAVQSTSIVKCYNSTTYECIAETNVGPDVVKILAGCDDIIKQHKSATLRVTALLIAPDKSLWIGTSAGVLLTIHASGQTPKISPLCHGHTGQVRFLTCCVTRDSWTVISGGDGYEEFRSAPAYVGTTGSTFSSMVAAAVGESGDLSGREDSTNHLLIWKIPKLM